MTSILILAGRRDGALDPLAQDAGVSHKCLVPIAGLPLIAHPLAAALAMPGVGKVLISTDDADILRAVPMIRTAEDQGRVKLVQAQDNLAGSIMTAGSVASFPMIVTTADNVLLTTVALTDFAERSIQSAGDATMALARREAVLAAHPQGQRRFYAFADGAFSNCNLYWIRTPEALDAARAFSGGGQFIKHPARIAAAFGLFNLLLFRLGRLRLARMTDRLSRALKVKIGAIEMADGRLAIDVDNARSYKIALGLLTGDTRLAA